MAGSIDDKPAVSLVAIEETEPAVASEGTPALLHPSAVNDYTDEGCIGEQLQVNDIDVRHQANNPRRASSVDPSPHEAVEAEDERCFNEKLHEVERGPAPAEFLRPFFYATIVHELSGEAFKKVESLEKTLLSVMLTEGDDCREAIIGMLDPSCNSRNDFLPYATNVVSQFKLAYELSGVLFVCLGEANIQNGWLKLLADDGLIARQRPVYAFVDEVAAQSHLHRTNGYTVDALLSNQASLKVMLEASVPIRHEWQSDQRRQLKEWQEHRALQLLMAEREKNLQEELRKQSRLKSLHEQRNTLDALAARSNSSESETSSRSAPSFHSPVTMSASARRRALPSASELVGFSCTQKPVEYYYEGHNWRKLNCLNPSGIILLFGLPGAGKTQLALRFADYISKHEALAFVYLFHFETSEAFKSDVDLLGEKFSLMPSGCTPREQFCAIIEALRSAAYIAVRKVLILDGATTKRFSDILGSMSLLESLLCCRQDFLFLLTSTSSENYQTVHADVIKYVAVDPLTPDEVEEIMKKKLHFKMSRDVPALARQLRLELSGLPVGIFPALAYMDRTGCKLDEYLKLLDDPIAAADPAVRLRSYPHSVRQSIKLAIGDLLRSAPTSSRSLPTMVLLVACFARQELPLSLLRSCFALGASGGVGNSAAGDMRRRVDATVSDIKSMCLFEDETCGDANMPLLTVHKVVHDVMHNMLLSDATLLTKTLELAVHGTFLEVELDMHQRDARRHAILLYPHVSHLTKLANGEFARFEKHSTQLCIIYLLHAISYLQMKAGTLDLAEASSSAALDRYCQLLHTTKGAMLKSTSYIKDGLNLALGCPLVGRLDALGATARMSQLLQQRRIHETASSPLGTTAQDEYTKSVHGGHALCPELLDAVYPYELLSAVLYLHGRALQHMGHIDESRTLFGLCLCLCEHVKQAHNVQLIYLMLAWRSGLLTLPQPAGDHVVELNSLWQTVYHYKELENDRNRYFQMGRMKLQPYFDDIHLLICSKEIVKCLRRLYQLTAGGQDRVLGTLQLAHFSKTRVNDDRVVPCVRQGALEIQKESFQHCRRMLKFANTTSVMLLGPCYMEYGHLTLQMLGQSGGPTHSVTYYSCGLAKLVQANMVTGAVVAVKEIADCHRQLGRIASDDLLGVLVPYVDQARSTCSNRSSGNYVDAAQSALDTLRSARDLYAVLTKHPDASRTLSKTFGTVMPPADTSSDAGKLAYAWRDAAYDMGYSDANISCECRLLMSDYERQSKVATIGVSSVRHHAVLRITGMLLSALWRGLV